MRINLLSVALMFACSVASATEKADLHKTKTTLGDQSEILLPANYRSWVAVAPTTPGMPGHSHGRLVSRIYVEPSAYDGFVKKGIWPDHSVIVLELRDKTVRPGPCAVIGLEVAAKNAPDFAEPWTYYGIMFDRQKRISEANADRPQTAPVDMRLAMFFPALRAVINAKPRAMQPSAF